MPAAAVAAVGIGASVYGANQQKKAANQASQAQVKANDASIAEQQRQFDAMRQMQQPYVDVGTQSLGGMKDIIGLNGTGAQQTAINNIQNSPFFQSQYEQAENAIMQHAAATGGLRGGNIQGALADNRMNMLYKNVMDQYQNLGGLTSMGQNAAAGVGNNGMNFANNISQLNQGIGQAQAGYALARGQANQNMVGTLMGGMGMAGKAMGWF